MSATDGGAIVAAVETYLRRHRSAGLYRLVDDLLRDPDLLVAFAMRGAVEVRNGEVVPPRPGTPEWWAALSAVRDAVLQLEAAGAVEYVQGLEVVNYRHHGSNGRGAGGPRPAMPQRPATTASARAAGSAQNKSASRRGKTTLDLWL